MYHILTMYHTYQRCPTTTVSTRGVTTTMTPTDSRSAPVTTHQAPSEEPPPPTRRSQWLPGIGHYNHLTRHFVPAGSRRIEGTTCQYLAICGARTLKVATRDGEGNPFPEHPKHERCQYLINKHRIVTD